MKIRVPDYFEKFKCIASECEDTCCAGWGIVIDDDTYKKYIKVKGQFGERLRSEIVSEAEENVFVLNGNNCPFLDEKKMCDIYKELEEEYLCYTCRQYPRYLEEFGGVREVGISLSCPEAARIILRNTSTVKFNLTENDEEVNTYNDINALLYMNLMQCRSLVFKILQDRNLELNIRVAITLLFINEVQNKIDSNDIQEIKTVIEKYSKESTKNNILKDLQKHSDKLRDKYINIKEILLVFKDLKHINPNDPLGIEDALRYFWQSESDKEAYEDVQRRFNEYYLNKIYKYEQILVYFVFRYFMKGVFDYDVIAKIKTAIVSYLMIKELSVVRYLENNSFTDEDMVDIAHTYSKDIEHLEENIETLAEIFETNSTFNIDNMLNTIMN